MSEWQVQPAQARKERQANKQPAWRVAADHAWERSGARFMMQQCDLGVPSCGGAFTPSTRLVSISQ